MVSTTADDRGAEVEVGGKRVDHGDLGLAGRVDRHIGHDALVGVHGLVGIGGPDGLQVRIEGLWIG